jgi:hypothetical protein
MRELTLQIEIRGMIRFLAFRVLAARSGESMTFCSAGRRIQVVIVRPKFHTGSNSEASTLPKRT